MMLLVINYLLKNLVQDNLELHFKVPTVFPVKTNQVMAGDYMKQSELKD